MASDQLTPEDMASFKAILDQEQGSLYDVGENFWASFQNSKEVFEAQTWEAKDLREMFKRDGSARAVQQVITGPISSASWTLKAAKADSGEAEWATDFLTLPAAQGGMKTSMNTVIRQMLSARIYRRAFFEKVYTKAPDGKIVYKKIAYRPPGTCSIRRDRDSGELLGFKQWPVRQGGSIQAADMMGVDIDALYAVVHINGLDIDPVNGYSDMEIVYWCHIQKFKLLFLWFLFCEMQANPKTLLIGGTGGQAVANARKLMAMKGGGVLGLDSDMNAQILQVTGAVGKTFEDAIGFLDRTMAESVLAGFLNLTGSSATGTHGSQALSKDQSSFFLESLNRVATEMQDTITDQIVAPLVQLNFGADAAIPSFEFGTIGDGDIDRIVTLMGTLSASTTQPFPAAFLFELAEKAGVYLDLNMADIKTEMDSAQKDAEEAASIALEQKRVALNTAKNPPAPAPPAGAQGFAASVNALGKKVTAAKQQKGAPTSGKPAAKPAAAASPAK